MMRILSEYKSMGLIKKSLSSYFPPQEDFRTYQYEQRSLRFSYGQGSFRILQSESESLENCPTKSQSHRIAPFGQREFRNVPSNVDWVRTSTSPQEDTNIVILPMVASNFTSLSI